MLHEPVARRATPGGDWPWTWTNGDAQEPPYRVLVADDQAPNLLIVQAFLKPLGCEVETVGDGFACLDAVHREAPDLILLDVMMPHLDGFEVCRELKANPKFRHIPIVLLTALNLSHDRVTGIEAGADDFISKPFNRHELMARVKSLIRVKRLEEHDRRHLRSTLERYLDSAVAQELMDRPELVAAVGRRQEASILFADVRDFSSWAERTPPEAVVEVINALLTMAVEVVFKHGGTVDKFTGDGLMAIFGAPVHHEDHPRRAVAAALEIVARSAEVTHPYLDEPLGVGCGVNSGEMVIGNIGCERRLDFTAIGDPVNVARRRDSAPGGQVWVTAATYDQLPGSCGQDLNLLRLKHHLEPVRTYAVATLR